MERTSWKPLSAPLASSSSIPTVEIVGESWCHDVRKYPEHIKRHVCFPRDCHLITRRRLVGVSKGTFGVIVLILDVHILFLIVLITVLESVICDVPSTWSLVYWRSMLHNK